MGSERWQKADGGRRGGKEEGEKNLHTPQGWEENYCQLPPTLLYSCILFIYLYISEKLKVPECDSYHVNTIWQL